MTAVDPTGGGATARPSGSRSVREWSPPPREGRKGERSPARAVPPALLVGLQHRRDHRLWFSLDRFEASPEAALDRHRSQFGGRRRHRQWIRMRRGAHHLNDHHTRDNRRSDCHKTHHPGVTLLTGSGASSRLPNRARNNWGGGASLAPPTAAGATAFRQRGQADVLHLTLHLTGIGVAPIGLLLHGADHHLVHPLVHRDALRKADRKCPCGTCPHSIS